MCEKINMLKKSTFFGTLKALVFIEFLACTSRVWYIGNQGFPIHCNSPEVNKNV